MWHEIGCVRVVSLQVMIEMAILTAMASVSRARQPRCSSMF
jgi:formate hydrogenlyase subunit 4